VLAHTCGTNAECAANAGTTCTVTCSESDLRSALAVVNACGGHRTIKFDFGTCGCGACPTCAISVLNTDTTATCGSQSYAMCLTGDSITIDGSNASGTVGPTFHYGGDVPCASCSGNCSGPQPALFVIRGNGNTVKNIGLEFFPEDIHVDSGNQHTISGITERYYCEEALDINGGTNVVVQNSTFVGATDPEAEQATKLCYKQRETAPPSSQTIPCTTDANCGGMCSGSGGNCSVDTDCFTGETCTPLTGQHCHCFDGTFASAPPNNGTCLIGFSSGTCYRKSLCGLDKAIQVNAGSLSVTGNSFTNTQTALLLTNANGSITATVSKNQVTGSSTDVILASEPTFRIEADDVCHGMVATGATTTASFVSNTIAQCKYGLRATQGAVLHATWNTIHDDYVSAIRVEDASTITGSFNRFKNNGTSPPLSGDQGRGAIVIADVNATVDFGNRFVANGEKGLNVFCGAHWSVFDIVSPSSAVCPGAVVAAQRNCFESGEQIADPYGKVDDTYHGAVGIDPLCLDYNLTCTF